MRTTGSRRNFAEYARRPAHPARKRHRFGRSGQDQDFMIAKSSKFSSITRILESSTFLCFIPHTFACLNLASSMRGFLVPRARQSSLWGLWLRNCHTSFQSGQTKILRSRLYGRKIHKRSKLEYRRRSLGPEQYRCGFRHLKRPN